MAEKMKGCPFFAGIKRHEAAKALAEHEQGIKERKKSGKFSSSNLPKAVDQELVKPSAGCPFKHANSDPEKPRNGCPVLHKAADEAKKLRSDASLYD